MENNRIVTDYKSIRKGGKIMKKRKRKKDKNHVSFNQIVATTLIAALSVTSVSLESLAAEPAQTAEIRRRPKRLSMQMTAWSVQKS